MSVIHSKEASMPNQADFSAEPLNGEVQSAHIAMIEEAYSRVSSPTKARVPRIHIGRTLHSEESNGAVSTPPEMVLIGCSDSPHKSSFLDRAGNQGSECLLVEIMQRKSPSDVCSVMDLLPLLDSDEYSIRESAAMQLAKGCVKELPDLLKAYSLPHLSAQQRYLIERSVMAIIYREVEMLEPVAFNLRDESWLSSRERQLSMSSSAYLELRAVLDNVPKHPLGSSVKLWVDAVEKSRLTITGEFLLRKDFTRAKDMLEQLRGSSIAIDDFLAIRPAPIYQCLHLIDDPSHTMHEVAKHAFNQVALKYREELQDDFNGNPTALKQAKAFLDGWLNNYQVRPDGRSVHSELTTSMNEVARSIRSLRTELDRFEAQQTDQDNMRLIGDAIQSGENLVAQELILRALDQRKRARLHGLTPMRPLWDDQDLLIAIVASAGNANAQFLEKVRSFLHVSDADLNRAFNNLTLLASSQSGTARGKVGALIIEQSFGEHIRRFVPPYMIP